LNQAELAKTIGISQSALSMILNDKRGIGWEVAKRMQTVSKRKAQWWMDAKLEQIIAELEGMRRVKRKIVKN
jgi:plasmid maintenance system antidote protein VapI